MGDIRKVADIASPANSHYYVYGDAEQYYSESQSPGSSYDMASASDLSNFPSTHGSPVPDDEESPDGTQDQKPAAKRKRENRYKNAPPAVLSRRRAQNRASQRAYRERKDQRIKDLEQMLDDAKQRNDVLSQAYTALHTEYVALKTSQLGDPSYPHQIDLTYGGPANMGMGPGVDGLEMDMFVYNDMQHPAYPY